MYFEVGAEGCAHDAQVLSRSQIENEFPAECYMLFDNGGPLVCQKILTPYKGMESTVDKTQFLTLTYLGRHLMYHLKEMTLGGNPLNRDQLFNLR